MRTLPNEAQPFPPTAIIDLGQLPADGASLPLAVDLAAAYVKSPADEVWDHWLWCRDTDALGQRVYLGKTDRGLEIHRHLHITSRFGTPVWR